MRTVNSAIEPKHSKIASFLSNEALRDGVEPDCAFVTRFSIYFIASSLAS